MYSTHTHKYGTYIHTPQLLQLLLQLQPTTTTTTTTTTTNFVVHLTGLLSHSYSGLNGEPIGITAPSVFDRLDAFPVIQTTYE